MIIGGETPSGEDTKGKEKQKGGEARKGQHKQVERVKRDAASLEADAGRKSTKFAVSKRAAGQFKSPLAPTAPAASSSSSLLRPAAVSGVRLTPTIQSLERKLQVTKRAVKILEDGERDGLRDLAKKWREVGRDVAWEVWMLVKDQVNNGDGAAGSSGGWGYDGQKEYGWDNEAGKGDEDGAKGRYEVEEEEERREETMGSMLRKMGIAPETLGWDDDREEWVDECNTIET